MPKKGVLEGWTDLAGEDGALLQQHQRAKEFDMSSQWIDRVTGTLHLDSNGDLVLVGTPTRTRLGPQWARSLAMQRRPAKPQLPQTELPKSTLADLSAPNFRPVVVERRGIKLVPQSRHRKNQL